MKRNKPRKHKEHEGTVCARLGALCVFVVIMMTIPVMAEEPIEVELGKSEAWVGEGVPLYITLKSPGPFSGTASFDLPEMAGTFFIKAGSPTVGSKTEGGKTWMTQRHEIRIYTQQGGKVVIPPIPVHFEAKADFLSEAGRHVGKTPELSFSSRRPPGTENISVIVSATDMKAEQVWTTNANEMEAGDVVIRRITRQAKDTTGMFFPLPDVSAPKGVRVYSTSPDIQDKTVRGKSTAEREDEIKYQFSNGGTFALPELEIIWWNTVDEKLETIILPGKDFDVKAVAYPQTGGEKPVWKWMWLLVPLLLLGFIFSNIRKFLKRPERLNRQAVIHACRANDPKRVYAAVLIWREGSFSPAFSNAWKTLSETVYSNSPKAWNGADFQRAFVKEARSSKPARRSEVNPLGPLNPKG